MLIGVSTVSVILPSYNESESICEAIDRITIALGDRLSEIIVVDDNSPDGTSDIVNAISNPKICLITRTNERGLASAIKTGVELASGNFIVWLDCDLGIHPEEIPRLVEKLSHNDLAIGSRYLPTGEDQRPVWRSSLSYLLNWFAQQFLGSGITDYSSGFIAVRKEVLDLVEINPTGVFGEYFIEFVYKCKKNGLRIVEIPYSYYDRPRGISKSSDTILTVVKLGWAYGLRIIALRFYSSY